MHYWPFPWEYSIWNTAVAALQFWKADLKPHIPRNAIEWVYTAFFHSNCKTCQKKYSLVTFDHLKWYLWKRLCTRRWRLWELEWELKHSHSSQKSNTNIPCFNKWEFILQSHNTTYHSWTTTRTLTLMIQMPQSCMTPFGVQQFWWREPCETQRPMSMALHYIR